MIGVISRTEQESVVGEFFELFKTPWEMFRDDRAYDVVVSTDSRALAPFAKLVVSFGRRETSRGGTHPTEAGSGGRHPVIEWEGTSVPIYGGLATFKGQPHAFLYCRGGEPAGLSRSFEGGRELRVGYDLFDEVGYLLRHGQPTEYAHVPTLDIHIAMLRQWILEAGIPVVEIPPSPYGNDFVTCLTHDIDFMGIRDHKFDHSMLGFVYRSLVPKYLKGLDRMTACARYLKNVRALLSLPLVHAGLLPDFWYPLSRYLEAEKELKSTFFFLPFKNRPGTTPAGRSVKYRAARYDVARYQDSIRSLKREGCEIALHGIDSWRDPRMAKDEIEAVRGVAGDGVIGVRMHWLYFSEDSPGNLDQAGFRYDSSVGYNETVGFRSGTSQVYRLPGASAVFELPLIVQDTAMFYPGRMGASEPDAIDLCARLIEETRRYGGAFTVNWHDRSLAPERNWDTAYRTLLEMLRKKRTWFATAGEAVAWFERRRASIFENAHFSGRDGKIRVRVGEQGNGPALALRVHRPAGASKGATNSLCSFVDQPLVRDMEISVGFSEDRSCFEQSSMERGRIS